MTEYLVAVNLAKLKLVSLFENKFKYDPLCIRIYNIYSNTLDELINIIKQNLEKELIPYRQSLDQSKLTINDCCGYFGEEAEVIIIGQKISNGHNMKLTNRDEQRWSNTLWLSIINQLYRKYGKFHRDLTMDLNESIFIESQKGLKVFFLDKKIFSNEETQAIDILGTNL
jgi:hypothetical protein